MKTRIIYLSSLIIFFALSSCAELVDCIASASPEIKTKELNIGYVGSPYYDFINSEVNNDSNDDSYNYYYDVDGILPPGLTYNTNGRKIYFQGTPTTTGVYTIKVNLTIDPPNYYNEDGSYFEDDNRICFGNDTTQKTFTITIE